MVIRKTKLNKFIKFKLDIDFKQEMDSQKIKKFISDFKNEKLTSYKKSTILESNDDFFMETSGINFKYDVFNHKKNSLVVFFREND